ncbi:two-component regulator propeller domain-containing protein [Pelagicoccus sp. SDUM812003]|uniref:two-component regulator propeller domain-containing protein n=1 Tax=Pelagicoccus sp. SDUM812003 TaxID=3041267 RepID=UPI00280E0C75|nr:two-component regulator propeller domain-containing protein [Pelagicoccus sp. SDUM812003]MDQ8202970.1 two-component regulator propeller domain-containing protein [Pelagicoccus sp. SDUM812003]
MNSCLLGGSRALWMLSIVLFALGQAWAKIGDRELDRLKFSPLEGLSSGPSGQVSAIVQGSNGFIWFGTREGAHRYDGYDFRTYSNRKDDPLSLVNSVVLAFQIDHLDRIWIGTEKGVSRYVPETDSFENYLLDPEERNSNLANHSNAFVVDSENRLYVSSESGFVYRYEEARDRFEPINAVPLGIIKSMVIDGEDRIWVGADSRLHRFDTREGGLVTYEEPFRSDDPSLDNFIESIAYVDDETIWLGTAADGAVRFNSVSEVAESMPRAFEGESYAHTLLIDDQKNLWIGHSSGITLYPNGQDDPIRYHSDLKEGPLPRSGIHSLLIDSQSNIWAGSAYHGIFVSSNNKRFHALPQYAGLSGSDKAVISALLEDREGNLWIGRNSQGVDILPASGGAMIRLRNDPSDPRSIPLNTVFDLFQDSFGEIWLGIYRGGLNRYDPETGYFERFVHDPDDPSSIGSNDVRGIQEDELGNLWVLTHGRGVSYFDRDSETFARLRQDPSDPDGSLIDDWANDILYLDGDLYVGTSIGFSILDTRTGQVENFDSDPQDPESLSNPVINTFFLDSKNRLWIGTGDGINLFDPLTKRFRSWSVEEGLPYRIVNAIQEDDAGQLWIGTDNGLARFDPEREGMDTYDSGDGLSDNAFYARAAIKSSDGRLMFGMKNGVTYFRPEEIEDNTYAPQVWITDFKVSNQSLKVDPDGEGNGTIQRSIWELDKVTLDYDQKVISIHFVALNFIQSHKNEYAYRLLGFDDDWNLVGSRREATYTNLNPGNYVFEVKASNNDGYWNETPRSLGIVVTPPFWGTLWFRLSSGIMVVALPIFLAMLRLHRVKRQRAKLASIVEERTRDLRSSNEKLESAYQLLEKNQHQITVQNQELITHRENLELMVSQRTRELEDAKEKAERSDRLKSAFLANMSHEIRTPMNAIVGLLEILRLESIDDEERRRYNDVIKQSSNTLLTLIDDILDLSRIESGEATIQLRNCDIDEICDELYSLYKYVAEKESEGAIRLELIRNGESGLRRDEGERLIASGFDPVRLKQILTNLLSNAIKFTEKGVVSFGYNSQVVDGTLRLEFFVSDTGIGIPDMHLDKVFDRFHKVEDYGDKVYRGTGLGLTISQRLVEMMSGRIFVASKLGKGTRFSVRFDRALEEGRPLDSPASTSVVRPASLREGGAESIDGSLSEVSLLVVEDEEPNYLVISKFLERSEARLDWARDGEEARRLFSERSYDLVLLDVKMPIMDGYEVLEYIRSTDTEIPVVMQTAYAMESDRQKAFREGASDFIAKPFSEDSLVASIQRCLRQRSA